jgi:hypothetical protein
MTETTAPERTDGFASFVPALRNGWASMGKFYGDNSGVTVSQALEDIDAGEIKGVSQYGEFRLNGQRFKEKQPRYQGTYRIRGDVAGGNPTIVPLAVVGIDFEIIQDKTTFAFVDELTGGPEVAAAGLMVHERRTFLAVRLPEIMIGGIDRAERYMLAYVGHDGGAKLTLAATNVRTDCSNVVNMTIRGAKRKFVIAHRPGANKRMQIEIAQNALGLTQKYDALWLEEAEKLIATPVGDAKFWEIVSHAYGPKQTDPSPQILARFDRTREQIAQLWNGDHNANIKGTGWGALQVLNEYDGWYRTVRGVTPAEADRRRFEKAILGENDGNTQHVQNIINAVV